MAVTKQTYSITPTWTASQLATIFRTAFIDAGLMTDWFDSFLSGSVENRILRIQYDNTKTYGTTFYWFMFTTTGVFLHVATGWDAATDLPTGTQYLDYFSTTTNSTGNHWQLYFAGTSNTVELVLYSSGINSSHRWFVVKSGSTRKSFGFIDESQLLQPWINLNSGFFPGFLHVVCSTGTNPLTRSGSVTFFRGPSLRRDLTIGSALNGSTSNTSYSTGCASLASLAYGTVGNSSNDFTANAVSTFSIESVNGPPGTGSRIGAIILPVGFTGTNPAFADNSSPVFHSIPTSPYTTTSMPSDFGVTFHYATNSFSQGDTLVVTAGVEEWEIIDFSANSSAITGASPLFLARVV